MEGKYWRTFKKEGGETLIHFDSRIITANEDDFARIGSVIYQESGGRITLIVDSCQYGILSLQENLAMSAGLNEYDLKDAVITVINKLIEKTPA